MNATFEQAVRDIYAVHPNHIFPYVGARYLDPDPAALRVLALGINAYVSAAHWPADGPSPTWFGSWFEKAKYRYQRRVLKDVAALAGALTTDGAIFHGRRFHGPGSVYATNAVKVYLPESTGKKAAQVGPEHFERHREQWHRELQTMAQHGVLPHLLVVFGELPWPTAWQAFSPSPTETKSGLVVRSFHNAKGPSQHHANLIGVELEGGRQHELVLVRLRHPSGRTPKGSPSWLLKQPDFKGLAGLAPGA